MINIKDEIHAPKLFYPLILGHLTYNTETGRNERPQKERNFMKF